MKRNIKISALCLLIAASINFPTFAESSSENGDKLIIEFPDIPGYRTLVCDFHMHTVFSDGRVWPDLRVQEALRNGLDAIAITDHLEYQPHKDDLPNPDRNRGYQLAQKAAEGTDLIVIRGAEITRSMPPGHSNAIFIKDANRLIQDDVMEVFREAKQQGAFVFYNHPQWANQQKNGVATLHEIHKELMAEGLLDGIEIVNWITYSDESLQIALDNNLTILGNSDVHGIINWDYENEEEGHRPVTLVFATDKSEEALKMALEEGRSAVWFHNTLVGKSEFLAPLVQSSLKVSRVGDDPVQTLMIENQSDADYVMENLSQYTLHDHASVFILKAHKTTRIQVKILENRSSFDLRFRILNAFSSPGKHPEISLVIE